MVLHETFLKKGVTICLNVRVKLFKTDLNKAFQVYTEFFFLFKHKLCVDYGLLNCNSIEKKSIMLHQLYELDALIFDTYDYRLNSITVTKEQREYKTEYLAFEKSYDSLKRKLIEVFGIIIR